MPIIGKKVVFFTIKICWRLFSQFYVLFIIIYDSNFNVFFPVGVFAHSWSLSLQEIQPAAQAESMARE